jgi:DNA repair protein RecN (Recombination protein N)
VLRRVIGAEGRSRAWINGAPTTLQMLRELGERLMDIHGQHEHQSLTRPAAASASCWMRACPMPRWHRRWRRHGRLARRGRTSARGWRPPGAIASNASTCCATSSGSSRRFAPVAGEAAELETEFSRLANAGKLAEGRRRRARADLRGRERRRARCRGAGRGAAGRTRRARPGLAEPQRLLAEAEIQLSEAATGLRRYLGGLEMDPARLDAVQSRLEG